MFRTAICAMGLFAACILPQSQDRSEALVSSARQSAAKAQPKGLFYQDTKGRLTVSQKRRELDVSIAEAARSLRQAKSDDERSTAEKKLKELLGTDYDQRMQGYEDELKRLEQTLEDMRKRLQKRRDAKTDMIELRIKVLEAEAEDLGWPARHTRSAFPTLIRGRSNTTWRESPSSKPESGSGGK